MRSLLLAALAPAAALAFSFSYTAPTSCDPITVLWSGGSPPFSLLLTPSLDVARNISIPSSSFSTSSQTGNFSTTLPLLAGHQFLLTMSDASGFGSGGTSQLLTVGSGSAACNTADPTLAFQFYLNGAAEQCQPLDVSWDANATAPVSIWGLIPLGQAFRLDTPAAGTTYDWTVNILTGTSFFLLAVDAAGNQGGTSSILSVGASDTSACIDSTSPSSTINSQPSQTSVSSASSSSSSTSSASPSSTTAAAATSSGTSAATIAGAVVGALALAAILAALLVFLLRRHRRHQRLASDSPSTFKRFANLGGGGLGGGGQGGMIDLLPNPSHSSLPRTQSYEPVPFLVPPIDGGTPSADGGSWEGGSAEGAYAGSTLPRRYEDPFSSRSRTRSSGTNTYGGFPPSTTPSTLPLPPSSVTDSTFPSSGAGRSSKRAEARANAAPARRYVLHTDAGSLAGESDEEEVAEGEGEAQEVVVELPPAYDPGFAARRARGQAPLPPPPPPEEGGQEQQGR